MSKPKFSSKRKGKKVDPYSLRGGDRAKSSRTKKGRGRPRRPIKLPPGVKRNTYDYDAAEKIPAMLAKRGKVSQLDTGLWAEPKWDGNRSFGIVVPKKVVIRSRSWKTDFAPQYHAVSDDLQELNAKRFVVDGELVFIDPSGKDVFLTGRASKSTIKEKGLKAVYMLYDLLYIGDKDLSDLPYRERRRILSELIPEGLEHVQDSPIIKENQKPYWERALLEKREGMMLKDPDAPYTYDRSRYWRKLKALYTEGADTYDAVIIGYTAGKGKYEGKLGALLLAQRSGDQWLYIGKAAGMDDDTRDMFTQQLMAKQVPKSKMPSIVDMTGKELRLSHAEVFVKPRRVVEIKASEQTTGGRLRWGSFERMRPDKGPMDATTELRPSSTGPKAKSMSAKARRRAEKRAKKKASVSELLTPAALTKKEKRRIRRAKRRAAKKGADSQPVELESETKEEKRKRRRRERRIARREARKSE